MVSGLSTAGPRFRSEPSSASSPAPPRVRDLDLRVYAPIPDVVIVRVGGPVDNLTAPLLADRVGKQFTRAPHVIIDLGEVNILSPHGLTVLRTLHREATARGRKVHIVGAEHDVVRRPLQATDLAQLLNFASTADAVIAGLPRPIVTRVGAHR